MQRPIFYLHDVGDLRNAADYQRDDSGDDDLGDHVEAIVDNGIEECQTLTAELLKNLCAEGEAILREEPLSPCAEEDVAGDDVGKIAKRESNYRADAQRCGRILYLVSEDAAEAEDSVGDYVVDEADANGFPEHHVAVGAGHEERRDGLEAEEHLNDCIDKTGEQTPLRAVAVSGENDRQHAEDGESAAEREIQERDEAAHDVEHGCDGDKQRTLNKNFCVAFLGC